MRRFIFSMAVIAVGALTATSGFAATAATAGNGVEFESAFADSTLRVTYALAGTAGDAAIYLEGMESQNGWAGRRHHLNELPLTGNGQIFVRDAESGDTIYATSFTTLFNEWIVTDEAMTTPRSFRYSFLVPQPVKAADISICVVDKYQKKIAEMTHRYDPMDILVRKWAGETTRHQYLHRGGDPAGAIDIAILAEGYRSDEMGLFIEDANKVADAILRHEPFKSHADKFNFVAVMTESADGEVSHPNRNEWHNTAFDSHYSTLYSDRYLTTPSSVKAHEMLRGIPYEHIIVLANTEQYGGGGFYNVITTAAAHHETMPNVVTHEFGHAFGGLADEYFYPGDQMSDLYEPGIEPWEQNITNLSDFKSKHWSEMMPAGTPCPTLPEDADKYPVGLYEGGGYIEKGMYRPADKCRMRVNDYPDFCPVCEAALIELIEFYTSE